MPALLFSPVRSLSRIKVLSELIRLPRNLSKATDKTRKNVKDSEKLGQAQEFYLKIWSGLEVSHESDTATAGCQHSFSLHN